MTTVLFRGARLFDGVGPAGPFILVGAFNAVVLCMAIVVRIVAPEPVPDPMPI